MAAAATRPLILLIAPLVWSISCVDGASIQSGIRLSPVTRVVELLKGLSDKIEKEGKAEESLYNKFICWGQTVVAAKTASNSASSSRADTLTTYIADIDAGRIEFTSERSDLEKELEQLNAELEAATELRNKENADFLEAKAEMDKAIDALTQASQVLKDATVGHEKGTLIALRGQLHVDQGFAARAAEADKLSYAVQLGEKFLTRGDAVFLRRLLTGSTEVPEWNWKKLNRKADFKMSYKARSFKIQDVLAKLLMTFNSNLEEATMKETGAQTLYDKLKHSKQEQRAAAEEALEKLEKESGAKGMSRAEASQELAELKEQISDDEKYISNLQDAMTSKKSEWQTRSALRTAELAAIAKAISILSGDDAKDLFKKSVASQGYSFLQRVGAGWSSGRVVAARLLSQTSTGDRRVDALASLVSKGHFDEVLKAIDSMVSILKAEEASDLETKEKCEKDRMDDTRAAVLTSRAMDDMTDSITRLTQEIGEIEAQIAIKKEEAASAEAELKQATRLREDEAAAYTAAKKDDTDALALVKSATEVLTKFYADNGLMLTQKRAGQPVVGPVAAGEAPPPPPTTWEEPYGGKTGEATGIIAVLNMVQEDIDKDIAKADASEADAISVYGKLKSALTTEMQEIASLVSTLEASKADKEGSIETTQGDRRLKSGELEVLMKKMKDAAPACNYFTINYEVRFKNRQIEIDGLLKAKSILAGGEFATPDDPTREIKPGDAFLQKAQPHTFLPTIS